ncbi:tetratricopeptide repeat protein [Leptospira wolffii]|uniref:tetratricopeptide repeat protein n=1 Tax=Leptospira wolffii TaxID=409998 RepID=UPI001082E380|nr:tetratricopeptide repeat protein [Leptospira wolffii]TGK62513.1 tetratricopeptide repeat protein [Leptospira wolffii]TGK66056.1 tetratricopeptide repeat protein [Leptospira wolffii]TGK74102.1 tetratricopeptide repeat protein [Leptospira wolffii]TGL28961.1 tetratricopeptide repeat protein [Leptospira wolffii]
MRTLFINLFVSFIFLPFVSIYSESAETNYSQIRELINLNKISQAQEALKPLLESDPDDPTLNLYQTEIWIIQGEENYHSGNLKTAYEYFTKAQTTWASHPTVRSRIAELQGKKLVDRPKNELKLKTSRSISPEIQNKGNVIVLADPEILELTNQLKTELRNRIAELGQESSGLVYKNEPSIFNNKIFFIFIGISLLSNLILSLLLFRRR